MAPLTLHQKYDDLVRCADQPVTSYENLTNDDLDDVISQSWPFITESITYTPVPATKTSTTVLPDVSTGSVQTRLERRLKIHFPLYSEAAKRCEQKFPSRRPARRNRTYANAYLNDTEPLSLDTSSTFSLEHLGEIRVPSFYVTCPPDSNDKPRVTNYDQVRNYIQTADQTSPYRMLVFHQALQECCRCGNYDQLRKLCFAANTSIEKIRFDNNDTVLHQSIKTNNQQLTEELIRFRFNVNADGELGTPLVTAAHYDILWAVEILLKHGADLTRRHVDWPFLTLYEYCVQFAKIDIKLTIDKYIVYLMHNRHYATIRKLIDHGWNIPWKKRRHIFNVQRFG